MSEPAAQPLQREKSSYLAGCVAVIFASILGGLALSLLTYLVQAALNPMPLAYSDDWRQEEFVFLWGAFSGFSATGIYWVLRPKIRWVLLALLIGFGALSYHFYNPITDPGDSSFNSPEGSGLF